MPLAIPYTPHVLVATGITLSALLAGFNTAHSLISIPVIQLASNDATLLAQWQHLLTIAGARALPMAFAATGSYLAAAVMMRKAGQIVAPRLAGAAALTIGIVPFTFLFIVKTNVEMSRRLQKFQAEGSVDDAAIGVSADEKSVAPSSARDDFTTASSMSLTNRWATLNLIRAMLPFAATIVGLGALR